MTLTGHSSIERGHRIDAEEFYRLLEGVVLDDVNIFNARLKQWQDYYNLRSPPRRPRRPDALRETLPEDANRVAGCS